MPEDSAIPRTSIGSEVKEGMRRRIQLDHPCGEAPGEGRDGEGRAGEGRAGEGRAGEGRAGEGRAGEGRAGEGCRGRSGTDAQPGRQGVCAGPGGFGTAGVGDTVPAREDAEVRCGRVQEIRGAQRCSEAQMVGFCLRGEDAMRGGGVGGRPLVVATKLDRRLVDTALRSGDHASYAHTELDCRLEAALRSGDHTAALRVNEAIMRRESARRQRGRMAHAACSELAGSFLNKPAPFALPQEQESVRRKKRQRLNWGMDVLRKSEGKGNMSSVAGADRSTAVTAATAATVVAARARFFGERFRSPGSASSVWRSAALRGHTTRRERGGRGPRGVTVTATCKPLDGRERGNFPGEDDRRRGEVLGRNHRPRLHGARTLHPVSRPHLPTFSPFPPPLPPQPHSPFLPFPHLFPPPPPRSPRSAFPRPPGDVVSRGVDRAFTELAELDQSPGSDGRQVINVPELYTGILIVYE
ncbi:unnamed protein product [Closterium sp. Naga37s-1]|nr:unnamed protein product [Closterium sp. Naga37s-1]